MQKNVKCLLLSPNEEPEVIIIKDDYREVKKVLEIESPVTCVQRKIGEKYFDIWIDDEGLLKDNVKGVAYCKDAYEVLVGKCLIANVEGDEMASLTDEDLEIIYQQLVYVNENKQICYHSTAGDINVTFEKGGVFVGYYV